MARKSQPPKPGIWKILWPLLFPFGTDDEWEKGTMPKWRQTAGAFWVGSVVVPIAALAFFGTLASIVPSGPGGVNMHEGPDPTCYPSSRC